MSIRASELAEEREAENIDENGGNGDALSDIFESVATDRTPLTVVDHSLILEPDHLSPAYLETLETKLGVLGLHASEELMHMVVLRMKELQVVAKEVGGCFSAHRMRYYLKRAYLAYVKSWPLYGCHFLQGILNEIEPGTMGNLKIVIAIGHRGIHFLDPTTWALIFQCKLGDIENCNIQPISRVEFRGAPTSARMLYLNVNGLEMNILTSDAYDFRNLLAVCASESLGRGSFPHGTEGGDDILESHFNRVDR